MRPEWDGVYVYNDPAMQREYPLASACQGKGRRDYESLDQFELRLTREQLREAREALSDLLAAMRGEKVDMLWVNASDWFEFIEATLARIPGTPDPETAEATHNRREEPKLAMPRCPRCDSPQPHLYPAVQHEGEVGSCRDDFHRQVTGQNTPRKIAENERMIALADAGRRL